MGVFHIRPARLGDARDLGALIDIAGEGIPSIFWREVAPRGQSALDFGADRARRTGVAFSYENALIAETGGAVAAMALAYRQPVHMPPPDYDDMPPLARPLAALEIEAPDTVYLNALAAYAPYRSKGAGSALLEVVEEDARRTGAPGLSLIASDHNTGAIRLYERVGFRETARRAMQGHAEYSATGDWILMVKSF